MVELERTREKGGKNPIRSKYRQTDIELRAKRKRHDKVYIHVYIHVHIPTYCRKEEKGGKEKRGSKCLKRRWLVGPTIFAETHIHSFAREHYVCMDMCTRARVSCFSLPVIRTCLCVRLSCMSIGVLTSLCPSTRNTYPTDPCVSHSFSSGWREARRGGMRDLGER